ncbi:hypothetical protein NIES2135_49360 [Leptolyngbya boryana NIES-2135]|jgi:hypothetical protein|uniref:Uncharacterized protein n=1 Tax=Leptolyngbya boryana NIES-2135 TaxID=1973484 RepID=A0A1Z4JN49_LEPBY|nr:MULTISPECIES: hypothetical protein [Leptolyngbya]BAY58063.1 hypothetical protein NIES2135_49360 [Leptolyngbya boryana NIES-2135]MBD2367506.1 hypothetical protein [Leptolyngbya sp. FACHB-161]MBD2374030.1 hypothetical protein [Leptolyngbya sp. FACHB-238]MBD2398170.1 hypothetical protein [Leptolyngbya sp. FACHB-239]MBD2404333.1 hypothetical protein [Leptolyngbya sp. FACHB-402]
MNAIEFQTTIKDGRIEIPERYKQEFGQQSNVKVVVIKQIEKGEPRNILEKLLENPIRIEGFAPLTRDEIYER